MAIEIESLAVAWAMEKFQHFYMPVISSWKLTRNHLNLYYQRVKPSNSKITADTARTFAYHFTIRYVPGVINQLADCLLWLGSQKDTLKLPKLHIHQITSQLHARSDRLQDIRITTQEDDDLALLKHTITIGWLNTIREVPSEIQPYWTFREELTVEDGIALKGTCIVIPHKKYQGTLNLILKGHLTLNKCKLEPKMLSIGQA